MPCKGGECVQSLSVTFTQLSKTGIKSEVSVIFQYHADCPFDHCTVDVISNRVLVVQLLSLRWSEDLRVQEVRKMLQSAHPVQVVVIQRPEVSDHDYIEEQERHLYSICIRTMALPLGRWDCWLHCFY